MTIFFSNIYMKKLINLGGCFYSFMIFENTKNRELKKMYGHNFFSSFNEYVFHMRFFQQLSKNVNKRKFYFFISRGRIF